MKRSVFLTLFPCIIAFDPTEPFDFVEDALLKYVNKSVDPCDDFYRHACSFDSPNSLVGSAFAELNEYLNYVQRDFFWNNLDVNTAYEKFEYKKGLLNNTKSMVEFYAGIFDTVCQKNRNMVFGFTINLAKIFEQHGYNSTELVKLQLTNEQNCTILTKNIRDAMNQPSTDNITSSWDEIIMFHMAVDSLTTAARDISSHLDVDVRRGIEQTRNMAEDMLEFAESLIKITPWAKNRKVVENIQKITSEMKIYDNYGKDFKTITNYLVAIEKSYVMCKTDFSFVQNNDLLCFIRTKYSIDLPDFDDLPYHFFLSDNAENAHPNLYFGYPNYYHTQYGKELASKLGYTGFSVGHELGHTFFDNHDKPEFLDYFSKEVENCVQKQYNSTCNEYKEDSCATTEEFLDDNGADIFGLQLAYELMKKYYGNRLGDTIERLQVTNEQLFFYAFAYNFCSSEPSNVEKEDNGLYEGHSANNVRINAAAQHPAFQEAFQCSSDSRMMKSATKQCIIYGNGAPETRKRKLFGGNLKNKIL